jgi:hypothetical protein
MHTSLPHSPSDRLAPLASDGEGGGQPTAGALIAGMLPTVTIMSNLFDESV